MARPYITLKFEQTLQNDTVVFYADGNYRTFTCRDADLQIFQYNNNSDPLSNNGAIFFADAVAKALTSDYEVLRDGKIVTVRSIQDGNDSFDFGVVTINNGNGSVVSIIDQVNSDGTQGIVAVDNRVTPLQINSITHNVVEVYQPPLNKDFVYGNAGDVVSTTINFDTFKDGSVGRFDFRYGLLNNDTTAISTDTQTNTPYIPDAYFRNFETNNVQSFSIDKATGDVSLNNPKNWQKDTVQLINNGGGNYDIVHVHYLAGFARTEDIAGDSLAYPDDFKGNASLKYIFEITSKEDEVSTSNLESSTIGNAQTYFNNGNIGYYGEFLNGGTAKYSVNSFAWDNAENQLDYTQQTKGIAQIETSGADFTAASEVIVKIQEINSIDDETQTLLANINDNRVKVEANGTPSSGANLLNVTATLNADPKKIDLEFEVKSYEYTGNYMVSVVVINNTASINHENVILTVDVANAGVDTSDWVLTAYPSSSIDDISLNPHYEMDITEAFNNMVGTVEDRILARWVFEDQSTDKTITKLKATLRSKNGSQVFDTYEVTPEQIEDAGGTIDTTKGYILASGDPRNSLKVVKTGNIYTIDYGFQLWDSMVNVDDLIFVFSVDGQQTLQTGETFSANKNWETAILGYSINSNPTDYTNILGYDLSRNEGTQADPKYLFESVDYSDLASGITLDSIGKNGTTKIDVTFAPDPTVLTTPPDIADINGYFGIRPCGGGQFEYRQFTTYSNPETDSPFEDWDDSGFTTFLDKIIDVDDKVHLRANLNYDKLKLAYPDTDQFELSFRMDKVQEFTPPSKYLILSNSRNFATEEITFNTQALAGATVIASLYDADDTEFNYEINGVPQADTATFESNLGSIVGTDPVSITNVDTTYIDSGIIIEHDTDFGNPQEIRYNFDQGDVALNDFVVWLDRGITITSITIPDILEVDGLELSIRTSNPSTEDWTLFDYDDITTQIAAINIDIQNAVALGAYAIHVKGNIITSNPVPDLVIEFSFDDGTTFLDRINYDVDNNVDFQFGNGIELEPTPGLGNCKVVSLDNGWASQFNWADSLPFTISMWYNNNNTGRAGNLRILTGINLSSGPVFQGVNIISYATNTINFDLIMNNSSVVGLVAKNILDDSKYLHLVWTYDGSQSNTGMKVFINGVEAETTLNNSGTALPTSTSVMEQFRMGQLNNPQFDDHIWKVKNVVFHDRVLTGEEIRKMHSDTTFIPSSGLLRHWDMGVISPTYPANPEYIYELTDDLNNSPDCFLENHSDTRTPF